MMKLNKRLDSYLFENGYFDSREKAKRNIMAGNVFINGKRKEKPGEKIKNIETIEIKQKELIYVSRGGLKIEKAFKVFDFEVKNLIAMDIGASTGGFTDCMLRNGAKKVYAIDVGYGQLDWKLRQDERVICLERKNFRHMDFEEINEKVDRITMDVSFISVVKLLEKIKIFLKENGEAVILIKPQFEAGKEFVGKNGIIKDKNIHENVLFDTLQEFKKNGLKVMALDYSPVKGTKGNIEYICYIKNTCNEEIDQNFDKMIDLVVNNAHNEL
ncbi:MAG: TlyA family RNA methyltransferase [Eubacteriaceae bacterium]